MAHVAVERSSADGKQPPATELSANARLHIREFAQKTLYRRLNPPNPMDESKVTANLENGQPDRALGSRRAC
jgi:HSP20 family molecular chaperone IbpA